MLIYLLNFISIPIYSLLFKDRKKLIISLVSLQLFLLLVLRADTFGTDLATYKIYFEHYKTMSFGEIISGFRIIGGSAHDYGVESGYVFLNWIIGKLGCNFNAYLVIYAALIIPSIAVFIDRYCEDAAIGFATFVSLGGFMSLFATMRQSLALAIFLFAIPALVDRKFWRFAIIVFFAGLFHQSFFIALLLYPLAKFKANRTLYAAMMLASVLLILCVPPLYNNLIFPILLKLGRYYYLSEFTFSAFFALLLIIAVVLMVFFRREHKEDNAMLCGFLMTLPFQALAFYIPVFSRLAGAVFINFLSPLFSTLVCSFKTQSQRIQARTVTYAVLFAFHLYTLIIEEVLVPYLPFWAV